MALVMKHRQRFHGRRPGRFQSAALRLSAAHIRIKGSARASRMECESFSQCGSRSGAAHTGLKHVLDFRGVRAVLLQHVALA
eukprot:4977126-Pyramimonas_sp.AAC.1